MLYSAQKVSRATDLQILHGDLESTAKLRKFLDRLQAFLRHFFEHFIPLIHQKCIRCPV